MQSGQALILSRRYSSIGTESQKHSSCSCSFDCGCSESGADSVKSVVAVVVEVVVVGADGGVRGATCAARLIFKEGRMKSVKFSLLTRTTIYSNQRIF